MKNQKSLRYWSYKLIVQTNLIVLCLMTLSIIFFMGLSIRFLSMNLSKSVSTQMTHLLESDMDISYNFFAEPYVLIENSDESTSLNLIDFEIYENSILVYEAQSNYFQIPTFVYDNALIRWINPINTALATDMNTGDLFKINIALNDQLIALVFIIFLSISIIFLTFTFILSRFVAHGFSHKLVIPINKLNDKIKSLSDENLKSFELEPLKFESPLCEIKTLTQNTNAIMKKIATHNQELSIKNAIIENQMNELSVIFNSIDQGIMYFGESLLVESTYSSLCKKIFGTDISGKSFSSLLNLDSNETLFLDDVLHQIFKADQFKTEVFISLLPRDIKVSNHELHLDYKCIQNTSKTPLLMVILSDLTLTNSLYRQLEKDQIHLKQLVKCFTNSEDVIALVQDLKLFLSQWEKSPPLLIDENFIRDIHTFKGNFSIFYFEHTVNELNSLENHLLKISDGHFKYTHTIKKALNQDLKIISQSIGTNFIENQSMNSSKVSSLKKYLENFSEYTIKLANEYGKKIKPIEIIGNDIQLNSNLYKQFLRSLVHIFKNIICHGIESEEERIGLHKDPYGQIICKIETLNKSLKLIISDDGRGIDLEKIKDKIQTLNPSVNLIPQETLVQHIFAPGISTEENKNNHSGMGVGLFALDQEIKLLGGQISANTKPFMGTTFTIELPLVQGIYQEKAIERLLAEFSNKVNAQFECIFETQSIEETFSLLDYTAIIKIGAPIHSMVFLSMNLGLIKHLISLYFKDAESDSPPYTLAKESLSEATNILLGNCLNAFDDFESSIVLGHPEVIHSQNAFVQSFNYSFIGRSYHFENYQMNLYFIPFETSEN